MLEVRSRTDPDWRRIAALDSASDGGSIRLVSAADLGLDHLDGFVLEVVVATAGLAVGGGNHLRVLVVTPDGSRTISSGRLFLANP